ncbi:hypothetical protein ABXK61_27535 [Burkholderia sola]|uniref:hypothetical protein n=1 Tax=Burkholderia TaxID=32008 RepID=UPI001AE4AF80|nr:hypothetical protein [Burkholderia sp. AcTa6-5]MBP0717035.1 hypothetical protein [Burkholderia sp. AcTa6-5]
MNYIDACIDFLNDARARNAKRERGAQSDFGADARRSHMAAFRFNIDISVVAAPTGHRRTPAPKLDRKGGVCGDRRRGWTDSLRT